MIKNSIFLMIGMLLWVPAVSWAGNKATPAGDYRKGLSLYGQGHYEEALVRFQMAIDENWVFWQSYQMVGYCYFELRDRESALKAFEESLKINPHNPKLAKVYNDLKTGHLEIPVRPVEASVQPVGTPVYIQTYYS